MGERELQSLSSEYRTRFAFAYEFNISYSIVMDRVRRGELAVHYVEGKTLINVAEALKACERKRLRKLANDLFAKV